MEFYMEVYEVDGSVKNERNVLIAPGVTENYENGANKNDQNYFIIKEMRLQFKENFTGVNDWLRGKVKQCWIFLKTREIEELTFDHSKLKLTFTHTNYFIIP